MLFNTRKVLLGFVLSLFLLPMVAFASTEFKGTETVNINKANAATLAAYLKGIGANKAEAIVKYRKSNGSFKSAADIKNVPGVGDETYKDIKSKIRFTRFTHYSRLNRIEITINHEFAINLNRH